MRESVGAMWIFSICLIFIIMMTAYLAISVNYAKAFRVKSHLVSMIEENEGYSPGLEEAVDNYLSNQGYTARGKCAENLNIRGNEEDWELKKCLSQDETGKCSACIYKANATNSKKEGPTQRAHYRVITFFKFDIPVVNSMLTFQVAGESRYIFNFANG